jgi:type I restriction enzyme S subunit
VYFENWFKSYDFYKEVMRNLEGSVREYLFYENFSNIKMPIPPVPEQEKIAQILTQCDKVIQLKIQLIDEKRYQKKWLMQNLLNPESGLRLPGFEGSEWKEELFGEIFSFGSSLSASREQLGGKGICYLHYGDIHSNDSYYINVKASENKLPRLDVNRPADKFLLNDGDIVFVDASEDYDGASKYVVVSNPDRVPFISGLHTIPVRSKNTTMSNMFKRYCFQSYYIKKQFAFYATGMKVLGLNKENLRKITVKYPSLLEQTAIANMLSTADHEIGLIEQELVQWHKKKKSLMQLLLKGRVRVTV